MNIYVKNDKNIYNITAQSNSAQEAALIANAWSEVSLEVLVEKADETLLLLTNEEKMKKIALDESDNFMLTYLQKQGLSSWAWGDLAYLTGIGSSSIIILSDTDIQDLPPISLDQRLEISKLMWMRDYAKESYYDARHQSTLARNAAMTSKPFILNYAVTPWDPIKPKTIRNASLGIVSGLILGVFWVFAKGWWQNTDEQRDVQ